MFNDLAGKRVLVTGASTGIGAAVAVAFAQQGSRVGIGYARSAEAAQNVLAGIKEAGADGALFQADVSKAGECRRLADEFVAKFGGIDVLINNAGGMVRRTSLAEETDELMGEVFDLNVRSVVVLSTAVIPHMRSAGGGAVVNTGSVAGRDGGGIGSGLYASSKSYVHGITRNMAKEFAKDGIRVNTVAPGYIATPFHDATPPERKQAMLGGIPMGRPGTPEECAATYLFFASKACSGYITGAIIDINGGLWMP